jgi:hypothetical protein
MVRTVELMCVLALGLFGGAAPSLRAQPLQSGLPGQPGAKTNPKKEAAHAEERLFLLHAVEDMLRTEPRAPSRGGRRELPTAFLDRAYRQQKLLYDTLRRHAQQNEDETFLTLLRYGEKDLELLNQCIKSIDRALTGISQELALARAKVTSEAMLSGLQYGLRASSEGADNETAFAQGLGAMAVSYARDEPRLRTLHTNAAQLSAAIKASSKDEYHDGKVRLHKEFTAECTRCGFPLEGTDATRNPFQIVTRARELLDGTNASVAELIEQAQSCEQAAKLVPPDRAYNVYRAAFLGLGGRLANSTAAKDLGATALPVKTKDAPLGGALARKLWRAYVRNEPFNVNITDEVIHGYMLGHAYAGDLTTAYTTILTSAATVTPYRSGRTIKQRITMKDTRSSRPAFWYDCGRIASVAGNAELALECLRQAVRHGFREREAALASLDLGNVRDDAVTGPKFKRLFP